MVKSIMRRNWSEEEVLYLSNLYEKDGLSLSEIFPLFSKKYNRTLEGIKIKIKKLKLKHTSEQTSEIKSRLNSGELNGMFGKNSPLKGLTKENSEIIRQASNKNSNTRKMMFKEGLLDNSGNKNPMYGTKSWNNGLNKFIDKRLEDYGKKVSITKKQEWAYKTDDEKNKVIKRLNDAMIQNRKPTKIENKIEDYIKSENFNYIKNYRIGRFLIDFFLVDYNLVIECDGDYWHSNPKFYDSKKLNKVQLKNKDRDNRKEELLNEKGIKFLRFWEYDIHNSFFDVSEKIKKTIINETKK